MANQTKISKYSTRAISGHYQYTKGGEYSLDGIEYVGEYHESNGAKYTGPVPTKFSKPLRRYYSNSLHYDYEKVKNFDVIAARFVDPVPYVYLPKNQAYDVGFDNRYFVEKINDDQSFAIEVDQVQYRSIGRAGGIDNGLYVYTTVRWKLTGTVTSITEYNQYELTRASYAVPSVVYAVKNFTEFGRITELNSTLKDVGIIPVIVDAPRRDELLATVQSYSSNRIFVTSSV